MPRVAPTTAHSLTHVTFNLHRCYFSDAHSCERGALLAAVDPSVRRTPGLIEGFSASVDDGQQLLGFGAGTGDPLTVSFLKVLCRQLSGRRSCPLWEAPLLFLFSLSSRVPAWLYDIF